MAGRDALKFQAGHAKDGLWSLGAQQQPYSRYPGVTYLIKDREGQLFGAAGIMSFPRGVNGKPRVPAPGGDLFGWNSALVSGKDTDGCLATAWRP